MQATLRKIGALFSKDFADAAKNPTMLLALAMPIGMILLYTRFMGMGDASSEASVFLTPFLLSSALCFSVAMIGSMAVVGGIAEEREKHTLRTLMLANVSAGQVLASRAALALAGILLADAVCYFLIDGDKGGLALYLGIGLLGSLPLVVLSLLVGLASRDQMTAGLFSMPLMFVAIAPIFGQFNETAKDVVAWLPTGGMDALVHLSAAGDLLGGDAIQPLLVIAVWLVASVLAFAFLFKRLARDN